MDKEIQLISDKPLDKYEQFLYEAMVKLQAFDVSGVAVIAITEGDIACVSTYHNMGIVEKQKAVSCIQHDVTVTIVKQMLDEYFEPKGDDTNGCF